MTKELPVCLDRKDNDKFFDEIIIGRFTRISFHRTLRIPDDGKTYNLPAGLGRFPIHRVEDYVDTVPESWLEDGGFFIPMYQKEAMFLQFDGPGWHPTIAKIATGKVNVINGKSYHDKIIPDNQDYILIPSQHWLDGIFAGEGVVKQFVAMPLGQGYTVEGQITDEEKYGGLQITVFDALDGRFPDRNPMEDLMARTYSENGAGILFQMAGQKAGVSMGLGAGGNIKQQIFKDKYGFGFWSNEKKANIVIHIVNSIEFKKITGFEPPESPISPEKYSALKIPWYSFYDEVAPVLKPPSIFKRILSIASINKKRGDILRYDSAVSINDKKRLIKIPSPDKSEIINNYREISVDQMKLCDWKSGLNTISYVIDVADSVKASDYIVRATCNFHLSFYEESKLDCTLALSQESNNIDALVIRANCFKNLGEYNSMGKDASVLANIRESESVGMELKTEASLLAQNYDEAVNIAKSWSMKNPESTKAKSMLAEAIQLALKSKKK